MDPHDATSITVKSEQLAAAAAPLSSYATSESPSTAATAAAPASVAGKKRKTRRKAVTEEEDIAILRAVAKIQPHRAPWGDIKKRWQRVADAAAAEVGGDSEVSVMLCQRRHDVLVDRFIVRRELEKDWPRNPELRQLLEGAVEDRKLRDETLDAATAKRTAKAMTRQPQLTMESLRAALAAATETETPEENTEMKTERSEEEEGEIVEEVAPSTEATSLEKLVATLERITPPTPTDKKWSSTPSMADALFASAPMSRSPTKRRAFVESTLVAVLDRIASLENAWLENAREERELKKQRLELEREVLKTAHAVEKPAERASPPPCQEEEKTEKVTDGDASKATGAADDAPMPDQANEQTPSAKSVESAAAIGNTEPMGDTSVERAREIGELGSSSEEGQVPNDQVSKTSAEDVAADRNQFTVTSAESGEEMMGADGTATVNGSSGTKDSVATSDEPTETRVASPSAVAQEPVSPVSAPESLAAKELSAAVGAGRPTTDPVSAEDFAQLKREFATLKSSLGASRIEQAQLKQQVGVLSLSLEETRREKNTLKAEVLSLQALLRDAASLAGTLKMLRDAHHKHEQNFQTYVNTIGARFDALRLEIRERHQLIQGKLAAVGATPGTKAPEEILLEIQKEQIRMQTNHRARLAELDQKVAQVVGPTAQLQAQLDKQHAVIQQLEASQNRRATDTETALAQLCEQLASERRERHDEYGTLLHSIEQVLAGQTTLI